MRILYVTTIAPTMNFFEEHFKMLRCDGHDVELACNCTKPYADGIKDLQLKTFQVPFSRSPLSPDNISAYRQLKKLVSKGNYDIVHCHTPNASIITRLVCRGLRKKGLKVFYTSHGFHFYKGAPLKNWMLFYPAEWLCAHWTDILITINKEDYALAQKCMHAVKVVYCPGVGIDMNKFGVAQIDKNALRQSLSIPENAKVLFSAGELNENKNHRHIICALAKINDPAVHYVIAGKGDLHEELLNCAKELGVEDRVHLLGYRVDMAELYHAADIFVLPSYREGLSVALMEAMASGLPCAVSKIRGNMDLIDEGKGGTLFDPHDVDKCSESLVSLLSLPQKNLQAMGIYNEEKVHFFGMNEVLDIMRRLY